ncbi:hypothetical protein RM697_00350 [Ichthyenterobacterium sp. W332]|uniref:Uncharacterized protein n=1 Tax=Microcosmobacter mediterraneus TaxID=3075607 RepID=A0ABU2YFX9_9FLAO|nr:hypothetical protein [Ichthyenterobacterium sp. W332]MDT0557073.1 hypothetical protein [Ichthyenterobacterium sp. W332]
MKTFIILIILSISCQIDLLAQTPEQKKQIEEAKRKADSIMNLPHIKEMMKKAKDAEAEFERLEKERKAKEKLKPKPNNKPKVETAKSKQSDFYWYKTMASNTDGMFKDWNYGAASLRAGFYDRKIRDYVYVSFGSISKDGEVNINLPTLDEEALPFKPITTPYSDGDMLFYFKHLNLDNVKTEWISTRFMLEVHQGYTVLGTIKMGNAIKPVVNLNAPCCTDKAGDGYTASYIYVKSPTQVSGSVDSKTGGKITHEINLKTGWNLIKIEVSGTVGNNQWKNMKHTSLSSMPTDAKYYFLKN